MLCTKFSFPHSLAFRLTKCICGQFLDIVKTHFLHCSHGETDCIPQCCLGYSQETWGFIFCMNKFTSCHYLPFNFLANELTLCYQLMSSLVDVVIANPTWIDLVVWVVWSYEVDAMVVAQTIGLYHDWHTTNAFLPLLLKFLVVCTDWRFFS
jgi:hypothetical protein